MVRSLIAEQDAATRTRLGLHLRETGRVEVVGECSDGFAAVGMWSTLRPELVVLDVALPELDGVEVLAAISDLPPARALLLGEPRGLEPYRRAGFAVLERPLDRDRLSAALEPVLAAPPEPREALRERIQTVLDARGRERPHAERLVVRSRRRVELVRTADIDWIEAARNYVRLHVGATSHRMRATISAVERLLDPHEFLRIHRSIIVNVDRMREVQPWSHGEAIVILEDGTRLNLSRGCRPQVDRYLARLSSGLH